MAGLPSVPGLPQKPVHTNLPMTRKEREAAAAAVGDHQLPTKGGVPSWRQDKQGGELIRPGHQNQPGPSNPYGPRSAEPRASLYSTLRPQSHSSFRGDPTHRHHPYARPRGAAEPTNPASLLQQPQAATQRRAENPYSIRPDGEPVARGVSSARDQQLAGPASAKPQGNRDGRISDSATTTTAKKRKASASAPPSPSSSTLEEGEVIEEGEMLERPTKWQRTASVAPSAASSGSVPTKKAQDKGKRATPGLVSSPVVSAAPAPTPVPKSRAVASKATKRPARAVPRPSSSASAAARASPRPSSSSSAASRASGSASVMDWASFLEYKDVPATSSGPAPASVNLADSSATSSLDDVTLGRSSAKNSVPTSTQPISPVSTSTSSDLAPAVSVAAFAAPANELVASAVLLVAATEPSPADFTIPEKESSPTSEPPPVSRSARKSPASDWSTGNPRSARKSVLAGKFLPAGEPTSARKSVPSGKSLPGSKSTSARKSLPAPKTDSGVKIGRVTKSKTGRPRKSNRPQFGGKTVWPGGYWVPPTNVVSSSGGEDDDQMQVDRINHVDKAFVSSGGFQGDDTSAVSNVESSATTTLSPSSGGEEASVSASIEAEDDNKDFVNSEATSTPAYPTVGGKARWNDSTPEPDESAESDNDNDDQYTMASSTFSQPQTSTEPTILSKTDDAVWIDVRVGSMVRQIQVDECVLPGFSTWWSAQEPDQPLYDLDLSGVLTEANEKAEREITAEEVFAVLEGIFAKMEDSVADMGTGETEPSSDGPRSYSPTEIWLAALIHDGLGLPKEVVKDLLSSLDRFCAEWEKKYFSGNYALLLDAGLEKCIASAKVFGWESQWRKLISNLAHSCGVRQADGRLIHNGFVLQENISRSTSSIILAARQEMVMAMTQKAMTYVQMHISEATCISPRCSTLRIGAIFAALMSAGLSPWPQADQEQAGLASGRSVCEIAAALSARSSAVTTNAGLGGTHGLRDPHAYLADLCNRCINPLADLYDQVGFEIVDTLVLYFEVIPFGGWGDPS